jgi:hypothetical protein
LPHSLQDAAAALVIADRAHKEHLVPQARGVRGKIERCAAQVFLLADYVPQDFANGYDFHRTASDV